MKRIILSTILVCCTLSLAAQETIRVNYKGAKPTISDFATAFLSAYDWNEESDDVLDEARNAMKQVWLAHLKGEKLSKEDKLTVDQKNGYICYEYQGDGYLSRKEMCYWNESDGKHKLFAYNVRCFFNGTYSPGQFDGLTFYRYDNATKKMTECAPPGFEQVLCRPFVQWFCLLRRTFSTSFSLKSFLSSKFCVLLRTVYYVPCNIFPVPHLIQISCRMCTRKSLSPL